MDVQEVSAIISNLGFPVVCVIALGLFIWKYGQKLIEDNAALRTQIMDSNKEREIRLHEQLVEAQAINKQAIETLAKYADRLDNIEDDVSEIKETLSKK